MLALRRLSPAPALVAALAVASLVSLSAPFAAMAGPAPVTVRVEGATETKLAATEVTTTTAAVNKDGNPADSCTGTSAAGALQLATAGNWSGPWFSGLGYSVETIAGESYPFTGLYYWNFWLDNKPSATGVCGAELSGGDSVLFFPECFSEVKGQCPPSPNPLGVQAPAVAEAGTPVAVTVTSYNHASGAPAPAAGATVSSEGAGASATTDAAGHAALTFPRPGTFTLHVSAPESVRTETAVCVHFANDGACASRGPSTGSPAGASSGGANRPYAGPYAIVANATGLVNGHSYLARSAPRVLAGTVSLHATLSDVRLRLTRRRAVSPGRAKCSYYDGIDERFHAMRCGAAHGRFFSVGARASFSYLLPAALSPGRYVLDIEASDAAGNRTTLARGTSRIVFYVR